MYPAPSHGTRSHKSRKCWPDSMRRTRKCTRKPQRPRCARVFLRGVCFSILTFHFYSTLIALSFRALHQSINHSLFALFPLSLYLSQSTFCSLCLFLSRPLSLSISLFCSTLRPFRSHAHAELDSRARRPASRHGRAQIRGGAQGRYAARTHAGTLRV